jgi:DNA repair protein RadC
MHEGHRQRIRRRVIEGGLDSFEPHQILELLLFYSIPRKDTNEIAHKLIDRFGSLSGVFEADIPELCKIKGISENSAVLLSVIPSLARIYSKDRWGDKPELDSSSKAGKYTINLFTGKNYECFYLIALDAQKRVQYAAQVHEGTINEAPIYPRLLVETALRHQANSVLIAHNHPGGSLKPSSADLEATKRIINALNAIDISVVDHIIVAGDKYFSFAEKGIL